MITFLELEYKNILSAGNNPISIQLDKNPLTLITGKNGAGKTTIISVIQFALYGKIDRKITKPQIVNSVNKKDALCRIMFKTNETDTYEVLRGIKPNIFKIFKNGVELPSESATKYDQKYLEEQIIKINFKTFSQIILLSSGNFVPFFSLPAEARRGVVEDLLDISIFSKMKKVHKNHFDAIRADHSELGHLITSKTNEIRNHKNTLKLIREQSSIDYEKNQAQINEYVKEIEKKSNDVDERITNITVIDRTISTEERIVKKDLTQQRNTILLTKNEIKQLVSGLKVIMNNEVCPTCQQDIDQIFKERKNDAAKWDARRLNDVLNTALEQERLLVERQDELTQERKVISKEQHTISQIQNDIRVIQGKIDYLNREMENSNNNKSPVGTEGVINESIEKCETELDSLNERLAASNNSIRNYTFIAEMLKDTGIRTKVIKKYLPVINSLMAKYLDYFSFFVLFSIDENFNETIKQRHYTDFSYSSFSEGEKSRLNLAILFTFRELLKIKNAARINLLFLDEIFQSALDEEGKEILLEVLKTISNENGENIFVISHDKNIMNDSENAFSDHIIFEKSGGFSKIMTND